MAMIMTAITFCATMFSHDNRLIYEQVFVFYLKRFFLGNDEEEIRGLGGN